MSKRGSLLIVEDEHVLRGLVAQFLRASGFAVAEAEDGPSGVERFEGDGPFDLALVDLNLPGFSGVEVCRRIRKLEPDQPVLICSAAILADHLDGLRALGIDQFLTKPYHPDDLRARVERLVGRRESPALATATPIR
jgi:DNA-binding response OmpR family regulator